MKVTDYVIAFLAERGVDTVFGVTGGAAVHLFDSVAKNARTTPVFTHHEQAAALAATNYARVRNSVGAAIVTTGPGGTNAITGLAAAWQDSIPCVFISGQTRKAHTSHGKGLRQVGSQEIDIVSIVRPLTKYAVMVEDVSSIRFHLEKAFHFAQEGRPGPVWIDLPLDFQWANIDPASLRGFDPKCVAQPTQQSESGEDSRRKCYEALSHAKRPLLLAGYGTRLSGAAAEFLRLAETLGIPFVCSWGASDIALATHPLYVGRPGVNGQRGANLAVQNCDLLLCIGSHLSIPLTGTIFEAFARDATVIVVDIDDRELEFRTVRVDIAIQSDARSFVQLMLGATSDCSVPRFDPWRDKCLHYRTYNELPAEWYAQTDYVNPYVFVEALSDELSEGDVAVVDGGGTVVYTAFQAFKVKRNQRLTLSTGICAMGTGLPESIGACFANRAANVACLVGDGSMQFNVQELQTIAHHNLPVKIFVFNNDGYLAIRHTQDQFLEAKHVGSHSDGGLSLPDFREVAKAYGIPSARIAGHTGMRDSIRQVLLSPGPVLCEIVISPYQEVMPRQGFNQRTDGTFAPRPLEDMWPFLDRKEFVENMIVRPWSDGQ